LQYTIETRQLTSESTHRPAHDVQPSRILVEAAGPDEAIARFVRENQSELVSLTKLAIGRESIATVKKDDAVFLVRVYAG
jgi:hypothetical protein